MDNGRSRVVAAVTILAVVWTVVYWLWPVEPLGEPGITFAEEPPASTEPLPVQPEPAEVQTVATPPVEAPLPTQPRVGVVPPAFTSHEVRTGQTMESIARGAYGDGSLWTVIARANPRVDPRELRAGMTLRIPIDPRNVQGLVVGDPGSAESSGAQGSTIEYVVAKGDTLGKISRTYYGSSGLWQVILDANRAILDRPEDLRPGMRLRIPPNPRAGAR